MLWRRQRRLLLLLPVAPALTFSCDLQQHPLLQALLLLQPLPLLLLLLLVGPHLLVPFLALASSCSHELGPLLLLLLPRVAAAGFVCCCLVKQQGQLGALLLQDLAIMGHVCRVHLALLLQHQLVLLCHCVQPSLMRALLLPLLLPLRVPLAVRCNGPVSVLLLGAAAAAAAARVA
jgi:hypothetical protein